MTRHIKQAMTINASEFVGLMNNSRVQLLVDASGEKTINCELGMMGVHTRIDRDPPTLKAAVKLST